MAQLSETTLSVDGIVKTFPGVKALSGVSFDCRPGEIHALVGENGAGKSTLMRILTGVYHADAGTISVGGRPVTITGPSDAARHGIAMVYQDTNLVPDLDAVQNIFLGQEPGGVLVDYRQMHADAAALLARLGETLDLHERVGDKPLAEKQIIELARALSRDAKILILDEPTSALTPREVERLFAILRDLRAQGTSIVFISHRLPEIFAIADRITVLKDGRMVGTRDTSATNADEIVTMMVGRDLSLAYPPRAATSGDIVLKVDGLSAPGAFEDASFAVRAGEILGFGGIAGSGQQDIARALFGLLPTSGSISINGVTQHLGKPADAIEAGVVYLPSDRRGEGMFLPHSISDNISLPHLKDWARLGILDISREKQAVAEQVASLKVKTPSVRQPVELLSGGNQQKVTFARWLLSDPKVCIFDEPTQGVDVGTKIEIYGLMRQLAERGIAIIVVSSDVQELIGISDRIHVVAQGRIVDEIAGADATEEKIIGSAVTSTVSKVTAAQPSARTKVASTSLGRGLRRYAPTLLLLALTLALCAYAATATPYFLTPRNAASLAIQIAPLVLVALGQFAVILLGGIDLSAGPNISLATAIASFLLVAGAPFGPVGGVFIILCAGLLVGLLNALLIQWLRLPDLVATLATFSAVSGMALIVRPAPGGLLDPEITGLVLARIGNVPVAFIVAVLAVLVFELLLLRGRLGLRLLATGSNTPAAFAAGIRTSRVRFLAYMFCGLMASVAGIVIASRIGSGDPQAGTNFTLLSITAVVLGGTSVFGGRGTALGVLVAACLLMIIQNAMNHLQISAYWQYVLTGGLTLLAVAIYAAQGGKSWRKLFERPAV
jgi:ribose transport system ATP-binding protein